MNPAFVVRTIRSQHNVGRHSHGGECLYTYGSGFLVGIRDSKQGDNGPQLWLDRTEWSALAKHVRTTP